VKSILERHGVAYGAESDEQRTMFWFDTMHLNSFTEKTDLRDKRLRQLPEPLFVWFVFEQLMLKVAESKTHVRRRVLERRAEGSPRQAESRVDVGQRRLSMLAVCSSVSEPRRSLGS
jgi:hypothetical protein